jgi:hypothetical protein
MFPKMHCLKDIWSMLCANSGQTKCFMSDIGIQHASYVFQPVCAGNMYPSPLTPHLPHLTAPYPHLS